MKNFYQILFVLLYFSCFSFGQEREGNIVEYFGKEKVEDINEGEVIHVFKEGLLLRNNNFPSETPSVLSDPLLARIISAGESGIMEGKVEDLGSFQEELKWGKIEVEENNEFNDRGLRSGYLYLEFTSDSERTLLFEASGHTLALINGLPHEGDHYDFGWSLIPVELKKGKNEFILSGGRFSHMRARLIESTQPIQFTKRDLTLPDILKEEQEPLLAGIRIMNMNSSWLKGASILVKVGKEELQTSLPSVSPLNIRKVSFSIPVPDNLPDTETIEALLQLKNNRGEIVDTDTIVLGIKSKYKHHKRTFLSNIDASVQYYSLAPSLDKESENQALFLSVHGASVEAVNQANAYDQKDWGHLVAPTNRRPFGFAWEDWGRLDALEVLAHSEELLNTDPKHTYLTGHSMGGHGTWYLGATYPDRFAAIAPCAGYPDLIEYRHSFIKRAEQRPEEYFESFGMNKAEFFDRLKPALENESDVLMDSVVRRAGNPSRTLKLKNNYLHFGIYVLHGEADSVVPTFIAREMRERLGKFHNDFTYYEYPDGTHWYGDHSVDWAPIFQFFKDRQIKASEEIDEIEFTTASPGVSASSHFVSIHQQEEAFELSSFKFKKTEEEISLETTNVETLEISFEEMGIPTAINEISLDGQILEIPEAGKNVFFTKKNEDWKISESTSTKEKGPHRNGGFKDAFTNRVVFVYGSKGTKEENEWYYNRAKFDAEKFWYRANGNIELIKDTDFKAADYPDQNVIIYGNMNNNAAWKSLLKNSPVQVSKGRMEVGNRKLEGDQWGAYFIFPRADSESASVGVVTATGARGMKGAYANDYLENATFFPDVMIFDDSMMSEGISGLKASGFFSNSWSVEDGDIIWRD